MGYPHSFPELLELDALDLTWKLRKKIMDENWLASLNFRAGNTSAWAGCDARISRSYVEMLAENGRNTGYGYGVFNEDVV